MALLAVFLFFANVGTQFWSDDLDRLIPLGDDLLSGTLSRVCNEYQYWTGRVTVTALTYLAINLSFRYSPAIFAVVNTLAFLALIFGVFRVAVGRLPKSGDGAGFLVLFAMIWFGASAIGEVAFWKTGSVGYLWVITAGVWLLVPCADLVFRGVSYAPSTSRVAASICLAALCGLGLENFTATVFFAQCTALVVGRSRGRRFKALVSILLPTVLIFFALIVSMISPGNEARSAAISAQYGGGGLNRIFIFSIAFIKVYLYGWIAYLYLFLLWRERDFAVRRHSLAFVLLSVLSAYILVLAPAIQIGGRKNFSSEILLICGTFPMVYRAMSTERHRTAAIQWLVGATLVLVLASCSAVLAFNYAIQQTMAERLALLSEAKRVGARSVDFPRIDVAWLWYKPTNRLAKKMFFYDDLISENVAGYKRAHGAENININLPN